MSKHADDRMHRSAPGSLVTDASGRTHMEARWTHRREPRQTARRLTAAPHQLTSHAPPGAWLAACRGVQEKVTARE